MKKIAALVITLTICLGLTKSVFAYPYHPTTSDTVLRVVNTISDIADPYNNCNYCRRVAMDDYYLRRQELAEHEMYMRAERLRMERCHHRFGPPPERRCYYRY